MNSQDEATRAGYYNRIMAAKRQLRIELDAGSLLPVREMQHHGWRDPQRAARNLVEHYRRSGRAYAVLADTLAAIAAHPETPERDFALIVPPTPTPPPVLDTRIVATILHGTTTIWKAEIYHAPNSGNLPPDHLWSVHTDAGRMEITTSWEAALTIGRTAALAAFARYATPRSA